ncbi:ABC transporter permease [Lentzea kentuckyensis]|uniref:ABC transporter permease n=1 Tax=Lentzea kentuckyensis TaxID=360086 RepID=UPI000A366A57|nr:ABC transporter permease [Lentzea kentuckyensis]
MAAALTVARSALTLFLVCLLVFLVTAALPGDAAVIAAGQHATPERIAELRAVLGLDQPLWSRFGGWLWAAVRGDLGSSLVDGRPVAPLLWSRFTATLFIAVPVWVLALGVGTPLALLLGWRGGHAGSAILAVVAALPEVVLAGGLVVVFATWLRWLPAVSLIPVGGTAADRPVALVLPVLSLALPATAWIARLMRGPVADVVRRPFVSAALLRGVPVPVVAVRHVLPHLSAPLAQAAAVLAGGVLTATAVVEAVFAYPGMGQLLATAVGTRDTPVLQGLAALVAVVVLVCVLAADAVAAVLARRVGAR